MVCPSCHAEVEDGASFCTKCGARLDAPRTCPHCGAELADDALFCPHCGAKAAQPAPEDKVNQEEAGPVSAEPALDVPSAVSELVSPSPADVDEDAAGVAAAVTAMWGADAAAGDMVSQAAPAGAEAAPAEPDVLKCPACGAPVTPQDPYCPSCGRRLNSPTTATRVYAGHTPREDSALDATVVDMARETAIPEAVAPEASQGSPFAPGSTGPMPVVPGTPQAGGAEGGKKKGNTAKIVGIVAGVVVLAAAVGGGVWFVTNQQREAELAAQQAQDAASALHDVAISVSADGWDTAAGASRLPVHVVGTRSDGTAVNEVQYVDSTGTGLELCQGTYTLSVAASPIAVDGAIYAVPDTSLSVSINTEDISADVDATGAGTIELAAIDAADVTDDQIEAAYTYASQDPGDDAPDAVALRTAATERRDKALSASEDDDDATKPTDSLHVEADSYEFDMPSYWKDRVTVYVDGNNVDIYSSKYPRLKVCNISVQRGATQSMGDIATGCMGDASIGQGHYASVWADRWGYIIGWANVSGSTDPDDFYTFEEAREIVDLQTGGATDYDSILEEMQESNGQSTLAYLVDDYLKSAIVDKIEPLQ